ncbi:MAG: DUF1934 domain-containing protein [Selenomonas sp.]|jgi:uncharacterized beta-barrel protein YwiB (DUF1934 family)|uniref:DUF1934 domain-containing protein n=1 Tax=Selenomonas sp. AE3005 TaxID=1485543 RepID=UPI0004815096|nr:DUF1934 domain-containing protein [Selenomonas sp. AE3005]MBQ1417508.1 DUF1934 domain-containing protein [Selenomonas sp.]MBQ1461474.1 DUF1934 domain-containing protein [Selenomonas sp.]MBQ1614627.1 DUF1934 domain-containing protein [Selenomonas sp.]MBQ1809484.1 DUF1934 domain-containing protein [Selenomonas sp.]MBQ1919488.1 DUF1934 domain-containing protein [Selenomonas sp.]
MTDTLAVEVTVEGVQVDTTGEKTVLKTAAQGKYTARAGKHYVRYEDASLHDTVVPTVLKFSAEGVTLIRRGAVDMQLEFRLGNRTRSVYRTPYGNFDLLVDTKKLDIIFDGGQGRIVAEYDLFLNDALQGHNTLNVVVNALPD